MLIPLNATLGAIVLDSTLLQQVAPYIAAVLTVLIFSYLLGDNFLYRIAVHLLIGVAAGYTLIVAFEAVLLPWWRVSFANGLLSPNAAFGVLPLLIGVLLAFKLSPRWARFGNLGLAVVLGVGTGVALWGAIVGTLLPLAQQTAHALTSDHLLDGIIGVVGTVCTLLYFTYLGVRRPNGQIDSPLPIRILAKIGQGVIVITLGATFGLVLLSALTVFTGVVADRLLPLRPG